MVSQPYRFIKGAVVTQSELGVTQTCPLFDSRLDSGRYTLTVEVYHRWDDAKVAVNAKSRDEVMEQPEQNG